MDEIKRIGGSINAVVVQLPERRHPGVVVQDDSMSNLLDLVREARHQLLLNDLDELAELLDELEGLVEGYVATIAAAVGTEGNAPR